MKVMNVMLPRSGTARLAQVLHIVPRKFVYMSGAPLGPISLMQYLEDDGTTLVTDVRIDRAFLVPGVFYGIEGMRIGGMRRLRIPPSFALVRWQAERLPKSYLHQVQISRRIVVYRTNGARSDRRTEFLKPKTLPHFCRVKTRLEPR